MPSVLFSLIYLLQDLLFTCVACHLCSSLGSWGSPERDLRGCWSCEVMVLDVGTSYQLMYFG